VFYTENTIKKGANTMTAYHALQRTSKRTGFNTRASGRFIANAIERGKNAEAFASKEREYLRKREAEQGCETVVYNDYCFIIGDGGYCVTMFRVPKWFGKKQYDGKREIRDVKKYARLYNLFEQEDYENGFCKVS